MRIRAIILYIQYDFHILISKFYNVTEISSFESSKLLLQGKKSCAREVEIKFYNVLFKEFKEKWKNNCDIIVR